MPKRKQPNQAKPNSEVKRAKTESKEVETIKEAFPFFSLPIDLQKFVPYKVSGSEDDVTRTLVALSATCKGLNTFFKDNVNERCAVKLLSYVDNADYVGIAKILKSNFSAMFVKVKVDSRQPDGTVKTVLISPLQYAFKLLDTKAWTMCLDEIKKRNNQKALDDFNTQLNEPIDYLNLDALFDAYDKHAILTTATDPDPDALAAAQEKYLPKHMINKFCAKETKHDAALIKKKILNHTLLQKRNGLLIGYTGAFVGDIGCNAFLNLLRSPLFSKSKNGIFKLLEMRKEELADLKKQKLDLDIGYKLK